MHGIHSLRPLEGNQRMDIFDKLPSVEDRTHATLSDRSSYKIKAIFFGAMGAKGPANKNKKTTS